MQNRECKTTRDGDSDRHSSGRIASTIIHTLIADDHPIVGDGLARLLATLPRFRCVGVTTSLAATRHLAQTVAWNLMILDLSFDDGNALECISEMLGTDLERRIVVISVHAGIGTCRRAVSAGAHGFASKHMPVPEFVDLLVRTMDRCAREEGNDRRRVCQSPSFAGDFVRVLSPREIEILRLLGEGRRPSEISRALFVGRSTISTHLRQIKSKLNLDTNGQLVRFALTNGLVADLQSSTHSDTGSGSDGSRLGCATG